MYSAETGINSHLLSEIDDNSYAYVILSIYTPCPDIHILRMTYDPVYEVFFLKGHSKMMPPQKWEFLDPSPFLVIICYYFLLSSSPLCLKVQSQV